MNMISAKLGDLLDLFNGKKIDLSDDGAYQAFGSNGIIGKSAKFNHPSSIVLGRVGAYCGSVKYSEEPFWASDNTIVTRPKSGHDLKYWYYKLKTASLNGYAGGAAQPLITHTIIKPITVTYHGDLPTQERIAAILSAYDDLIENNRRRIALLEQAARLLYREWFVHFRFPGHETAKFVDGLPEGWELRSIGEHCPFVYGKALTADTRIAGGVDVYGSSGIVGKHNKKLVDGNAIVIGRKGNVGSVFWARNDFWPIDTAYYVAPKNSDLFTFHALENVTFINTDVAVPGLNRNFAHSRLLAIPDNDLLVAFNNQVGLLMDQTASLKNQAEKLTRARDLLLPRLMDGRIPV